MKKCFALLVVLYISTFIMPYSYSQKGELRISVEGGASLPLGNYGSHSFAVENSMFANSGGIFEASLGYFITKNLSLDFGINYSRNSVNSESFYSQYLSNHSNSIGYNLPPKSIEYVARLPYENTGYYLGLGTHFLKGKNERLIIQSKIQFGINSYFVSSYSSVLHYDDPSGEDEREILDVGAVYGNGFSFLLSGGIGYKFSERLGVFLNLEYCSTRYNYSTNYIRYEEDNSFYYSYEEGKVTFDSPVSWINVNGGLYFSIIKSKS